MPSFATGIICALILAGGTWWAMQAGTIFVAEKFNDSSTIIGDIRENNAFREPAAAPANTDGS